MTATNAYKALPQGTQTLLANTVMLGVAAYLAYKFVLPKVGQKIEDVVLGPEIETPADTPWYQEPVRLPFAHTTSEAVAGSWLSKPIDWSFLYSWIGSDEPSEPVDPFGNSSAPLSGPADSGEWGR